MRLSLGSLVKKRKVPKFEVRCCGPDLLGACRRPVRFAVRFHSSNGGIAYVLTCGWHLDSAVDLMLVLYKTVSVQVSRARGRF